MSSQSKETSGLDHTKHNCLSHHHIKSPLCIMKGFMFFTHFRDCSVKTELVCRNNEAKNSLNCFLSGNKVNQQFSVYLQFSMSFAFELTSGQWSRGTENRTSPFGEFFEHLLLDVVPDSLWTVLFARHFSLSFVPQEMSLNIYIMELFL